MCKNLKRQIKRNGGSIKDVSVITKFQNVLELQVIYKSVNTILTNMYTGWTFLPGNFIGLLKSKFLKLKNWHGKWNPILFPRNPIPTFLLELLSSPLKSYKIFLSSTSSPFLLFTNHHSTNPLFHWRYSFNSQTLKTKNPFQRQLIWH